MTERPQVVLADVEAAARARYTQEVQDIILPLCAALRELVASGPNSIERLAALAVLQRHGIRLDRGDAP